MRSRSFWLAALFIGAFAFAQALPGQVNGRTSHRSTATPGVTDGGGEVQFNQSGKLGGVANVVSQDGLNITSVGSYVIPTFPTPPTTGSTYFDNVYDAGLPLIPMRVDAFMQYPVPASMMGGANGMFWPLGSYMNWQCQCRLPDTWNSTTILSYGTATAMSTQNAGGTLASAWSSSFPAGRVKHLTFQSGSTANSFASYFNPSFTSWRGNATGAGGFFWWSRFFISSSTASQSIFAGLANSIATFSNVQPSTMTDVVYLGNDQANPAQTTLHVCSNDNVGTATCTDLGINFPTTAIGAAYDVWFYAPPNGSSIGWAVERLDSEARATGTITSDLPRNTVQLAWHTSMWNGADGGALVKLDFAGMCGCDNW